MRNNEANRSSLSDDMRPRAEIKEPRESLKDLSHPSRDSICIPDSLVAALPSCAVSCIETFVDVQYSEATCGEKQSLDFLCTTPNNSGLTIGEGGLQCIFSDCTGSALGDIQVYSICAGISNAVPETVGTITATLPNSATMSTSTYPFSIGISTETESVTSTSTYPSSIGLSTDTESITSTTTPARLPTSTFPASFATTVTTTSTGDPAAASHATSVPVSTTPAQSSLTPRPGKLSSSQIAGIAVAGAAIVIIVGVLLAILVCVRKRRTRRRRSERWSITNGPSPPAAGDFPGSTKAGASSPALNGYNPDKRFYAPQPAMQKRRSLWRKSLKPEEIGVAVSPQMAQNASPASTTSQHTLARLLPHENSRSLWPAPLSMVGKPPGQTVEQPTQSVGRNQIEIPGIVVHPSTQPVVAPQHAREEKYTRFARRPLPAPLQIGDLATRTSAKPDRMPLTPVYDNGNFAKNHPTQKPPLEKAKVATQPPDIRDSQSTDIEEDVTPEHELGRPVRSQQISSFTSIYPLENILPEYMSGQYKTQNQGGRPPVGPQPSLEPESPIKGLRYPPIPRPAAISSQAERLARPRASLRVNTGDHPLFLPAAAQARSRSDESYIHTDSSSSQGRYPPVWPVNSSHGKAYGHTAPRQRPPYPQPSLRYGPVLPRAQYQRPPPAAPSRFFAPPPPTMQRTPPRQAGRAPPPAEGLRLTPGKTSGGDWYLTLEG